MSAFPDDVCFGSEFRGKTDRGLALLRIQPPMVKIFFAFDYFIPNITAFILDIAF